jgi:hypothetical protein
MAARGLENVTLITEPEAAAVYYASQVRVEDGSTIAVYDLGGGTFDTAVLRKAGSNRFELVGRPEGIENLGGADFDADVFRYVAEHTGDVLAGLNPADTGVLGALARLRRECVEAKEALSSDSEATISVLLPGVQQQVRLVRSEFEALIEDSVRDTVDALEQSLAQLKLVPADLSAVLLIGGSSRIPLVAQLISEQLDRPIAVDADPKSSICMGAAVSAVLARGEVPEAQEPTAAGEATPKDEVTGVVPASDGAGHVAGRRASWSRKKGPTAAAALSGAASATAASGTSAGHSHGGAHAPKPTVRLTAIAAAATLITVLGATAAQSPEGFSNLTAMFAPGGGATAEAGKAPGDSGVPGAGSGQGAGAAAAGEPVAGIEAGAAAPGGGAGLDVEASPTSRPSSKAAAANGTAGGSTAPAAGSPGSTGAAGGGTAAGTTDPTGTSPGAVDPVTGQPVPANPGTSDPGTPATTPGPTTPVPDPTTPVPDPTTPVPETTTPIPVPPAPTTDPAPIPVPPAPTTDPPVVVPTETQTPLPPAPEPVTTVTSTVPAATDPVTTSQPAA